MTGASFTVTDPRDGHPGLIIECQGIGHLNSMRALRVEGAIAEANGYDGVGETTHVQRIRKGHDNKKLKSNK